MQIKTGDVCVLHNGIKVVIGPKAKVFEKSKPYEAYEFYSKKLYCFINPDGENYYGFTDYSVESIISTANTNLFLED